jgi:DNA-binding MarR family transcriptional regulator
VPDPDDRRAKLVMPTARGCEVLDVAQRLAPEIEERVERLLGAARLSALRADLEAIRADFAGTT